MLPKQLLREVRFMMIKEQIRADQQVTSYGVAEKVGLSDEKGVYKLLNKFYNTNFTELRKNILNGNI